MKIFSENINCLLFLVIFLPFFSFFLVFLVNVTSLTKNYETTKFLVFLPTFFLFLNAVNSIF